jgi:hypothetical protein
MQERARIACRYLQQLSISLEPRLSLRWLSNVALVTKIILLPYPPALLRARGGGGGGAVQHALNVTVPHNLNMTHLKQGVQHSSLLVRRCVRGPRA